MKIEIDVENIGNELIDLLGERLGLEALTIVQDHITYNDHVGID